MDFDFKVDREIMPLSEVIHDGISEQGIELDYILPDYYPDIFKLIKCEAMPEILSYSVSENKLSYDLCVNVLIWYCAEDNAGLNTLRQKLTYSKTLELGQDISAAEIILKPKTDYINCRVVNRKRIDIKGAVTTKIRVLCEKGKEVVCDARGMNIQLKKMPVEYSVGRLHAEKSAMISESVEMSTSKPPVISVIKTDVCALAPETKIIANKLVVKGDAEVNILYSCDDAGKPSMETMRYTLPYSQIVDMDGLDETYSCFVRAEAVNCDISPAENNTFKCEFTVNMYCNAVRASQAELITDLYSTRYDCDFTVSRVRISKSPVPVCEHTTAKYTLEHNDGSIEKIYDVWCCAKNISLRTEEETKSVQLSGMLKYSALVRGSDGKPVLIEKENAYEHKLPLDCIENGSILEADAEVKNCTYTLASNNKIMITADIVISGKLCRFSETNAVTDITIEGQEARKKDGDCAIKLYFGSEGESIWNIAKKYGTSVKAVMEENDLYDEKLSGNSMLLIPIVK